MTNTIRLHWVLIIVDFVGEEKAYKNPIQRKKLHGDEWEEKNEIRSVSKNNQKRKI